MSRRGHMRQVLKEVLKVGALFNEGLSMLTLYVTQKTTETSLRVNYFVICFILIVLINYQDRQTVSCHVFCLFTANRSYYNLFMMFMWVRF